MEKHSSKMSAQQFTCRDQAESQSWKATTVTKPLLLYLGMHGLITQVLLTLKTVHSEKFCSVRIHGVKCLRKVQLLSQQ